MDYDQKLKALNLFLPPPPKPVGSYRPVIFAGPIAYLSGQISKNAEGQILSGRAGNLSVEEARRAAEAAALNLLSVIKHLVSFERFSRMLKLVGYVQVTPEFTAVSDVINAASDLLVAVFGDNGVHARTSAGMASLPLNAAVELEATIELKVS